MLDYDFPPPSGQALGLSLAAGPSPLRGEGYCLAAGRRPRRHLPEVEHPPVHLVLAVDTSAAMRWGGRLDMVRSAPRAACPAAPSGRPALPDRLQRRGPRGDPGRWPRRVRSIRSGHAIAQGGRVEQRGGRPGQGVSARRTAGSGQPAGCPHRALDRRRAGPVAGVGPAHCGRGRPRRPATPSNCTSST